MIKAELQPVEVEWTDAASMRGWRDPETVKRDSGTTPNRTVGYLTRLDRKTVQIIQSRMDLRVENLADSWGQALTIPRACVKRIRLLR